MGKVPCKKDALFLDKETQEIDDTFHIGKKVKERWQIIMKLGAGGFGQIYIVNDLYLKEIAALKAEYGQPATKCQLPIELHVLKRCQGQPHSVRLFGAGIEGICNFIVMQLLGPNLGTLRRLCPSDPKRFSCGTVTRISFQAIESLRDLHSVHVIHRDIKPSNFAMGYPNSDKKDTLYVLDFGLSRFYAMPDGELRPPRSKAGFRGTLRYCTIHAHDRIDLSRGDDIVSLFYMMIELASGSLPWSSITKSGAVRDLKEGYPPPLLSKRLPSLAELTRIAEHIDHLEFYDKPDYDMILNALNCAMKRLNIGLKDKWDWENNFESIANDLPPLPLPPPLPPTTKSKREAVRRPASALDDEIIPAKKKTTPFGLAASQQQRLSKKEEDKDKDVES